MSDKVKISAEIDNFDKELEASRTSLDELRTDIEAGRENTQLANIRALLYELRGGFEPTDTIIEESEAEVLAELVELATDDTTGLLDQAFFDTVVAHLGLKATVTEIGATGETELNEADLLLVAPPAMPAAQALTDLMTAVRNHTSNAVGVNYSKPKFEGDVNAARTALASLSTPTKIALKAMIPGTHQSLEDMLFGGTLNAADLDRAWQDIENKKAVNSAREDSLAARNNYELGIRQRQALRSVPNIGRMVSEIKAQYEANPSLTAEQREVAMKGELRDRVMNQVATRFDAWVESQIKFIDETLIEPKRRNALIQMFEDEGVGAEGIFSGENMGNGLGVAGRFMFGGNGFSLMSDDPMLKHFLGDRESEISTALMKALKTGMETGNRPNLDNLSFENYRTDIEAKFDTDFEDFTIDQIDNHFRQLDPHNDKLDAESLYRKLQSVPKVWQTSEWAEKYEQYVIVTGPDAADFDAWIDSQDVHPWERLMKMLMGLFEGFKEMTGKDEDSEEWERLKTWREKAGIAEDGTFSETPELDEINGILEEEGFQALSEVLQQQNVTWNVRNQDGTAFMPGNPGAYHETLNGLTSLVGENPAASVLVTSGLSIEELKLVMEAQDKTNKDTGLRVVFDTTGFRIQRKPRTNPGQELIDDIAYSFSASIIDGKDRRFDFASLAENELRLSLLLKPKTTLLEQGLSDEQAKELLFTGNLEWMTPLKQLMNRTQPLQWAGANLTPADFQNFYDMKEAKKFHGFDMDDSSTAFAMAGGVLTKTKVPKQAMIRVHKPGWNIHFKNVRDLFDWMAADCPKLP